MRMRRLRSPGPGTRPASRRRRGVGVAVLAIAALLLVAGASGADEPDGKRCRVGEPARRSPFGTARWTLDRRSREAVTRHPCGGRRWRRHRGAGAWLDGCGTSSAARGAEPARVQGGADRARARVLPGVQRLRDRARCPLARDRGSRSRREGSLSRSGGDPRRGRSRQRRRSPGRRRRQAARRRHPRLLRAPASRWRCSTRASISCTRTSAAP